MRRTTRTTDRRWQPMHMCPSTCVGHQ